MKPALACRNCRARKKKCDRAYPICSYCLRTHDRCSYRVTNRPVQVTRVSPAPINVVSSKTMPSAALFLDYRSFRESHHPTTAVKIPVGPELQEYILGDFQLQEYVRTYINAFDNWLSFVPRDTLRTITSFSASTSQPSGEDILLLACIKNLTLPLAEDTPCNKQYLAIKSAFLGAEIAGAISVRLLQALLLLLLYEFGHGIYPCVYTTLGTCIRYLVVLGIDGAGPCCNEPGSWMEVETRRRLWWAVFVMERAIAIGCPERPLSIKEPDESKILPSDDISWEQGYPTPQSHFTLTTPAAYKMGTFRLLVHACYLLGQVLHYKADQDTHEIERDKQLYSTIRALANVLEGEGQPGVMAITVPRSILNSAIFILYPATDQVVLENLQVQQSPCHQSASLFMDRSRTVLAGVLGSIGTTSPILLHWGFQSFKYYYTIYQQDGRRESQLALDHLSKVFHVMGQRWKLAGVYMAIINSIQTATVVS